jgi:hypothetical protein
MVIDVGSMEPFDAGLQPEPDAGMMTPTDGGQVIEPGPDGGMVVRQPILAFQGGGCSAAPVLLPFLAILALRRRSRRS